MEFGKLPDISQVDFRLPADPPGNAEILRNFPVRNPHFVIPVGNLIPNPQSPIRNPKVSGQVPQSLYVGATGWSVKEWVGKIYPKGTKTTEYLRHYSRQFNTIELNTTHYRIPDSFTVQHLSLIHIS